MPQLLPLSGCIIGSLPYVPGIPSSKLGPLLLSLFLILYTPRPEICGDSSGALARKRSLSNSYADTLLTDGAHLHSQGCSLAFGPLPVIFRISDKTVPFWLRGRG